MPTFRYIGAVERYYPDRALTVVTGDVADWPEAPDPYWTPVTTEPDSVQFEGGDGQ
jgi:hypothetical protein